VRHDATANAQSIRPVSTQPEWYSDQLDPSQVSGVQLTRLEVRDFRCIEEADLEFASRCNLISGPNASGKTSLLEAIFVLGRGRSFRTPRTDLLIRRGAHEFTLTGRIEAPAPGSSRPVGLRYGRDGFEARAAGVPIRSLAELATVFPVQAIDPEVHRLIEEGPQERRRYLDWGVFHVKPGFVDQWRRYQRVLKQRNAALREQADAAVVRAWDTELIETGEALAASRREYLAWLRPAVHTMGKRLVGQPVELRLADGWPHDTSLREALDHNWGRDRERGTTHGGPHRADLSIRVGDEPARHRVSRGQQKLTAAAMLLGQLECDHALGSPTAALLVDDPAAELDSEHLQSLLDVIWGLPGQLFVTALNPELSAFLGLPDARRFHVEHGKIHRLL
jgi:DNA replication and repair protein RecF